MDRENVPSRNRPDRISAAGLQTCAENQAKRKREISGRLEAQRENQRKCAENYEEYVLDAWRDDTVGVTLIFPNLDY